MTTTPKSKRLALTTGQINLLKALRDHPFLSRRQLELYLHINLRTIRLYAQDLKERGWIQRHNASQPWMNTRSLFSLTPKGVEEVARRSGLATDNMIRQAGLSMPRLERLIVMMERAFQVRTFLLWLQQTKPEWEWSITHWDVEVGKLFEAKGKAFQVPFHGAAIMRRPDGRWTAIVVEWDLRRVPIEKDREHIVQLVVAQDDARYWERGREDSFPIWVLIAQDDLRLQDYYSILRAASVARQLPLPHAYLTTFREFLTLRDNPAAAIWYSTISGQRMPLLYGIEGTTLPLPDQPPWKRLTLDTPRSGKKSGAMTPEILAGLAQGSKQKPNTEPLNSPVAAALLLKPREKRILDEVASHPLLSANEMASLLHLSTKRSRLGTRKLANLELVGEHSISDQETQEAVALTSGDINASVARAAIPEPRFLLAQKGMHYLAMVAGFGNGVRRYAKARGWADGFDKLLRYWEHTREENAFFISLARIAEKRGHELSWLSELESRLYYSEGNDYSAHLPRRRAKRETGSGEPSASKSNRSDQSRVWRHSFLPDGRGTYSANGKRYDFALEIDRSRMAEAKIRRKLTEYYACLTGNVLRGRGIEFLRLLMVTNSWERAETLRKVALELDAAFQGEGILSVFITTFDRLRASGANSPIWLRVDPGQQGGSALTQPKTYCFECFIPKTQAPREPGRVTYIG
ncbi:MAG: hypothetical protein M1132_01035 [Chloroflexi bacterium]|nr:hypothetical protein [Chloroflexota bacterium]MCL5950303.1 hypothetical protein [Chloroflexota bacterium]